MFGRDYEESQLPRVKCEMCEGSGKDPKKRTRRCPQCGGRGEHPERCKECGEIRFCPCETEPGVMY